MYSIEGGKGIKMIFNPRFPEFGVEEPEEFANIYHGILDSLDYILNTIQHGIINLSLAPPNPYSFYEFEPVNIATKMASKFGFVVIAAVGNGGRKKNQNMLSPWSVGDHV
ncbi:MAG: hypothetical protein WBP83_00820, partial [Nitrososphaeraceae archaeon]